MVEFTLGGRFLHTKVAQLVTDCKEVKKFAMKILRRSLSQLLPVVAIEEDILDNILRYLNPLAEDCKFVETTEEDKTILTSIYRHLGEIYSWMRRGLFTFSYEEVKEVYRDYRDNKRNPLLRDQLQEILAEISEIKKGEDQGGEEGQNQ